MQLRTIEEIEIDQMGRLLVRPELVGGESYAMIYRAANGLRWDSKEKAIRASEPERWTHSELLHHVVRALAGECGTTLQVSDSTRWINVSEEQVAALIAAAASEGSADV